jgi:hypothetical protein
MQNTAGAATTTLFGIDIGLNDLVTQNPATGLLTTSGPLGVDPSDLTGFDILTTTAGETAFAALTVGNQSGIYTIDLVTGAATFLRNAPGTVELKGLAVRAAALTFVSDQMVTFTDVDGDFVRIKVSQGTLSATDFQVIPSGKGLQLRTINFSDDTIDAVNEFSGARLTVDSFARRHGDGLVNIGYINATNVDLGFVRVDGDLGQIDAGSSTNPGPGLGGLNVHSLGRLGLSTQVLASSLVSTITGVPDRSSSLTTSMARSPGCWDRAAIERVQLGGSLLGGMPGDSGQILSEGTIGPVKIGGDIQGGAGDASGTVFAIGTVAKVVVKGSVRGGAGTDSGAITCLLGLGRIRIGGDRLRAPNGPGRCGRDPATAIGGLSAVAIWSAVRPIFRFNVTNRRNAATGAGVGDITIAGSLISGTSQFTGIFGNTTTGKVAIGEDLRGSSATTPVNSGPAPSPATMEEALAIASVTIGGTAKMPTSSPATPRGIATNADVRLACPCRRRLGGERCRRRHPEQRPIFR